MHSRYDRHLADLPSLGRTVSIHLRVRRFYCRNTACPRQTFVEGLSDLMAPFARRTRRLAEAQGQAGAALGAEAGARLLAHLSMPASADTVLRLIKATPLPDQPVPRVIGVDDWAMRKGSRYGTRLLLGSGVVDGLIRQSPPPGRQAELCRADGRCARTERS